MLKAKTAGNADKLAATDATRPVKDVTPDESPSENRERRYYVARH